MRLDEINVLESYSNSNAHKLKKKTSEEMDREIHFDSSVSGSEEDDEVVLIQIEEIKYNKVIKKIPEELHVYVQPSVFQQFHKELDGYEKWKKLM